MYDYYHHFSLSEMSHGTSAHLRLIELLSRKFPLTLYSSTLISFNPSYFLLNLCPCNPTNIPIHSFPFSLCVLLPMTLTDHRLSCGGRLGQVYSGRLTVCPRRQHRPFLLVATGAAKAVVAVVVVVVMVTVERWGGGRPEGLV